MTTTVTEVGRGNGQALLSLSRGYPNARLIGLDNYAPAITAANANARAAGLADRVRFEVCDVAKGLPGRYDLITLFDVVHDMPHPKLALASIASALEPGGTCLVVDFNLYGDLPSNLDHPLGIGAFGYSASLNLHG
jgi:tRNA A58 N-methylase Trm61